ncbi:MAG TPA: BsuPI-related putative proteinase inhibitor [Gemmatimonadales bacterium]|nr:BsuPI-related putative proteinase inhibitor [Gemmatimonadales bacterium]
MMRATGWWWCGVVALWTFAGCNGGRAAAGLGPPGGDPLTIEVESPRETLAMGESMTVRFNLRNTGADTVRLTFPSGCTVLPFVTTSDTLDIHYPQGGGWACTMALTEMTLVPGGVETREMEVTAGGAAGGDRAVLGPGNYLVFARLEHPERALRSPMVPLTVR